MFRRLARCVDLIEAIDRSIHPLAILKIRILQAGFAIRYKNIEPTARRFACKPAGLTYLRWITQPDKSDGLGYVNRWAFGPKAQKNRNYKI